MKTLIPLLIVIDSVLIFLTILLEIALMPLVIMLIILQNCQDIIAYFKMLLYNSNCPDIEYSEKNIPPNYILDEKDGKRYWIHISKYIKK